MPLKVIVSGAGVAGLAVAYWLDRIGASTIVIERAPRFHALGHYISLKGNGVEMVRRMGIFDACQARAAPIDETACTRRRGASCAPSARRRSPRRSAVTSSSVGP